MSALLANALIFVALIAALCGPPACLALLLWRRQARMLSDWPRLFWGGIALAAGSGAVNLCVMLFAAPQLGGRAMGGLHVGALLLAWLCVCAAVALVLALPRRRRYAA